MKTDEYWISVARSVAEGATCSRRKVGAVLVNDRGLLIATGHNETPSDRPTCINGGCPRGQSSVAPYSDYSPGQPGYCVARHAEAVCLANAYELGMIDYYGWSSTLYVTCEPCSDCWTLIKDSGIPYVKYPVGNKIVHDLT